MDKKQMAFAGSWYPATAGECRPFITSVLDESEDLLKGEFIGGIVPHAGWYYSGSIACRVIASLAQNPSDVDTVVLFGGHMLDSSSPFLMGRGAVETPFGDIEVDAELADALSIETGIAVKPPSSFPDENTFELQNPFIKHFFPEARIVMCAVAPNDSARSIGLAAAAIAQDLGRTLRVIGSTDMTHYGPNFGLMTAGTGKDAVKWVENENDRCALNAMVAMDETKIISCGLDTKSMCCPGAAAATAAACKKMGAANAIELDYATSYEKSASDSFVGYSGVLYSR